MSNALRPYVPVCDAIALLFRPHAEVVLHDLASGKIAHIANSYSKRKVGDSSLIASEPPFDSAATDVIGPYAKARWDGRRLKSVTAVLRDGRQRAIGLLCINYDVETFAGALQHLQRLIELPAPAEPPRALLSNDWREAVNSRVADFLSRHDTTLDGLTTRDRDDLLEELRAAGIFAIRNAVPYVAEILRLSRATLYNRLRATQHP